MYRSRPAATLSEVSSSRNIFVGPKLLRYIHKGRKKRSKSASPIGRTPASRRRPMTSVVRKDE